MRNVLLYTKFFGIILLTVTHSSEDNSCDDNTKKWHHEGNLGETSIFPWLGVLRVNIFDGNEHKMAATGIVLVKPKYAIVNAHDVAGIPKAVLKRDSKAYFIPKSGEPWTAFLIDYTIHPEYEYNTYNTIALLELDTTTHVISSLESPAEVMFPMKPICWPGYSYNTSNELYVLGFTDERALFEKIAYRITFVENELCKEFYSRAGIEDKDKMSRFICGVASSNKEHCAWDSGMILASNATGMWTLIGFGLHGPGCTGPARFLDLTEYQVWIMSSTSIEEFSYDYYDEKYQIGYKENKEIYES